MVRWICIWKKKRLFIIYGLLQNFLIKEILMPTGTSDEFQQSGKQVDSDRIVGDKGTDGTAASK